MSSKLFDGTIIGNPPESVEFIKDSLRASTAHSTIARMSGRINMKGEVTRLTSSSRKHLRFSEYFTEAESSHANFKQALHKSYINASFNAGVLTDTTGMRLGILADQRA